MKNYKPSKIEVADKGTSFYLELGILDSEKGGEKNVDRDSTVKRKDS